VALLAWPASLFVAFVLALPASAAAAPLSVREGNARFQILSPTLIRLEYAPGGCPPRGR